MAFTERYVTSAAAGGGAGTSGDPWTLAEGFNQAVAGDRVNIQSDSAYSIGATTITNVGTTAQAIIFRGYNSTIGDLESAGRTGNQGELDTTNFPAITLTGIFQPSVRSICESLSFTGSLNSRLIGNTTSDLVMFANCSILNSANNAGALALQLDNNIFLINCDLECSGATHATVVNADDYLTLKSCRIKSTANNCVSARVLHVFDCVLFGSGSHTAVVVEVTSTNLSFVCGNTIYGMDTAISLPNSAPSWPVVIVNNHITDCGNYINNLYSATANVFVMESNNRVRDNTTPRTGVGDGLEVREIVTDTGGAETDYTDAASDDFTLISAAPGKGAGLVPFTDCGALQREESAGGGGLLTHPGMSGGMRG